MDKLAVPMIIIAILAVLASAALNRAFAGSHVIVDGRPAVMMSASDWDMYRAEIMRLADENNRLRAQAQRCKAM